MILVLMKKEYFLVHRHKLKKNSIYLIILIYKIKYNYNNKLFKSQIKFIRPNSLK